MIETWIITYLVGAGVGSLSTWYMFWLRGRKKDYSYIGRWLTDFEHRLKRGGNYRELAKKKH